MPQTHRGLVVSVMVAVIWLIPIPATAVTAPETLDECDRMVRDAPDMGDSYYCYTRFVYAHGQEAEAVRRLEAVLAIDPDRHRARLNLAIIEDKRGSPRAETLFREAADGMEEDGDLIGVVYGCTALADVLRVRNRAAEAWPELDRAMKAAQETADPMLIAWVWNAQARQAMSDSDCGRALRLYRRAEAIVFPDGRLDLQCRILSGIGSVLWYFRDYEGAMEVYRREAELQGRAGNRYGQASPLYNLALLASEFGHELGMGKEEIRALKLEALKAAVDAGDLDVEARTRMLLGQDESGAAAVAELQRALALARRTGDLSRQLQAKRLIAQHTVDIGPDHVEEGLNLLREAVSEARSMGSPFDEARGLIGLAFLITIHRSREEAVPVYLEALDVVERIRIRQPDEMVRARVFTHWTYPYYRLSGHLLRGLERSSEPDSDLDLAFRTVERLRVRTLLDTLNAAGAVSPPVDDALASALEDLLGKISETQRELMKPDLAGIARDELLAELDSLEVRENDLRDVIARDDPRFAELHTPDIPSIEAVQDALENDQALLSFHLWGSNDANARELDIGDSWLMVVTKEGVGSYPIPDRMLIRDQVEIFDGLLANRDGSEAKAAVILYEGLLREAVEDLPDGIRRLVIIPDGALHKFPFDALRDAPDGYPSASRFEISIVPSATVWKRLGKGNGVDLQRSRALAVADPDLSECYGIDRLRTADPWIEGLRLGRLPHAAAEARAVVRAVGGGSRLLTDVEANEHILKNLDLERYGILHFASHAVVDDERPGRSAILLAAGGGSDDGLLQVREIVELDLAGKVVILTGCRSASGAVMEGEGVMGLARAFFQAGATTVIGGLWPLRDDDTALLMEEFARQIGKGRSVGAAMAEAKRSRIDAGSPAASWAGLVVLGDADVVPVPGGSRGWLHPLGLGAAVLMAALLFWVVVRMRGR